MRCLMVAFMACLRFPSRRGVDVWRDRGCKHRAGRRAASLRLRRTQILQRRRGPENLLRAPCRTRVAYACATARRIDSYEMAPQPINWLRFEDHCTLLRPQTLQMAIDKVHGVRNGAFAFRPVQRRSRRRVLRRSSL
jgi:hypothetical protein